MRIGFVTYWFERGAAYVTRQYMQLLEENNELYVYARGGVYAKGNPIWDTDNVTWGIRQNGPSDIFWPDFDKWIKHNKLDVIFFNEQREMNVVVKLRKKYPQVKIGAYIDYYRADTVQDFGIYDFLICNTRRHYSVFSWHPYCYYVPWGTDIDLFKPKTSNKKLQMVTFFHSMGLSTRKGSDALLDVFLRTDLHEKSRLIIHTQEGNRPETSLSDEELLKNNVEIIEKTVTAPGLYHLGDVYVYPTILEGIGLTMYEALSCGLPLITTDEPPMNEVVVNGVGELVEVESYKSREDGYYWPLSYVNKKSLYDKMMIYANHPEKIADISQQARRVAVEKYNWTDRKNEIIDIFNKTPIREFSAEDLDKYLRKKELGKQTADFVLAVKQIFSPKRWFR